MLFIYRQLYILYGDIKSAEDVRILQENLNKLAIWVKNWGMQFNIDKCLVLSVTLKHDPSYKYEMEPTLATFDMSGL